MSFYNLVSNQHRLILSVQPKCGCNTIRHWVRQHSGMNRVESYMIENESISDPQFRQFEKVLIVRNPFERLVSYYCMFVIAGGSDGAWSHLDRAKTISLSHASFREMIELLRDLPSEQYQHHLIPQTSGIEVDWFDTIVNIRGFNDLLRDRRLPGAQIRNRQSRHHYKLSVVDVLPAEFEPKRVPTLDNFLDDELIDTTKNEIYPMDQGLLGKYL